MAISSGWFAASKYGRNLEKKIPFCCCSDQVGRVIQMSSLVKKFAKLFENYFVQNLVAQCLHSAYTQLELYEE